MTDAELIEQAAGMVPIYCDGFGAYRKINGVLRTVGFVLESGVTLNLIISLAGAGQANIDTARVLRQATPKAIWNGAALSH